MKFNKMHKGLFVSAMAVVLVSCKAKQVVVQEPAPVVKTEPAPAQVPAPAPKATPAPVFKPSTPAPAPTVEKPNFEFGIIQFEFNSSVLKTASLLVLDAAIFEMKKSPNTKFVLSGHSSAEGSAAHNMTLSIDRANAVKTFFVNAGLNADNFRIVGDGDKKPRVSNDTEEGRAMNRRTEIKVDK